MNFKSSSLPTPLPTGAQNLSTSSRATRATAGRCSRFSAWR